MKTFTEFSATIEPHSVDTPQGVIGGYLVRCAASRKTLGYIWPAGAVWRWRTDDGQAYGERSTQRLAVEVLRDAFNVAHGIALSADQPRQPRLPLDETTREILDAWKSTPIIRRPRPPAPVSDRRFDELRQKFGGTAPDPDPEPDPTPDPKPTKRIVWNDDAPVLDVTAALADAFKKRK
jgi:hypothetical protein